MKKHLIKNIFKLFIVTLLFNFNALKVSCTKLDYYDFDTMDIDLDLLESVPTKNPDDLFDKLIGVVQEIKTPLWNKTKPPKGRDTLYLIPHRISSLEYGGVILNLFFNFTSNMGFSINEVLKLDENKEALNQFTEVLIDELDAKEASSLIPLFKKLSIQERKAGALMQAAFTKGPFRIEVDTSLQISERNFWLSKKDQARIKEMFSDTDSTFDENELYKIKFGMGDTRIKLGLNSLNMSNFQIDLGFEGILPTSKFSTDPKLEEYEVNLDNIKNDIPNVLRSIRDNLITPQLGNFGHFGLGCYAETKIDMFHNILHLWNRISFDNLFSAREYRLIPDKRTIQEVDIGELANPEYFTKFIKEYIFPPAYEVTVQSGDIFNVVSALSFELSKNWNFSVGYDYYHQQEESFGTIHTTENINNLKTEVASSPAASQHKVFTEGNYVKKQKNWDLILGMGGDYTVSSKNLGHDWTIFLRAGMIF